MSPEQKAGKEVTTRSDIYSLGLVLHEMFTGKVGANDSKSAQSTPSELVKELDPSIDPLILRCLEEDPKRRPSSVLSVAMALPGGDPIAAALAAGETPSPEMIAVSQEKEGFSPRTAWACFGVLLALLAAVSVIHGKLDLQARAPLEIPRTRWRSAPRLSCTDWATRTSQRTPLTGSIAATRISCSPSRTRTQHGETSCWQRINQPLSASGIANTAAYSMPTLFWSILLCLLTSASKGL
jgi:serine/threonine protein kinase